MNQSYQSFCKVITVTIVTLSSVIAFAQNAPQHYVELKNGMRLGPGFVSAIDSISKSSVAQGDGDLKGGAIHAIDDNLRYTFYSASPLVLIGEQLSNAPAPTVFVLPTSSEIETTGGEVAMKPIGMSDFNVHGRRTYEVQLASGRKSLLQALTLIAPKYCKVETLRVSNSIAWDMRIGTDTIHPKKLNEILHHELDLTRSSEWLKLVRFYIEAERFVEASKELTTALEKFPGELADQKPVLTQINILKAKHLFDEIKIRRAGGQSQLAAAFLQSFDLQTLPLETQLQVQKQVDTIKQEVEKVTLILEALRVDIEKLKPDDKAMLAPVLKEINDEVTLDTIARLADYQRLRADASLSTEQHVAYAISGWLLGSGAGIDNLATVKSLARVRENVKRYLNESTETGRSKLLAEIKAEEGGQAEMVAKLLASMKPPSKMPTQKPGDPPGLYRMKKNVDGENVEYLVQLPPEYDPNRKYPCVLALPQGQSAEYLINWWCGTAIQLGQQEAEDEDDPKNLRFGQTTRYGYIVVSPNWMTEKQSTYRYTEPEQERVLSCYRDALRTFSIDTDRVFISGHFQGATAAWDIAYSHPDLWAGTVLISPTADKFIVHYEKSAELVPTYVVWGRFDNSGFLQQIGRTVDGYLKNPRCDVIGVEYQGREGGVFPEEIPRIMEWMQLSSHTRQIAPKSLAMKTMRPGDRFFYWLESPEIESINNAFQFDPRKYSLVEASLNAQENMIRVSKFPSRSTYIWLSPEIIDFARPALIDVKGKRQRLELSPDVGIMLEDARRRADRQHPFWQKVEFP